MIMKRENLEVCWVIDHLRHGERRSQGITTLIGTMSVLPLIQKVDKLTFAQTQPPESPPPFQPYSSHNPAPGNTNGLISIAPIPRPNPQRHFLGGILPTSFLPRQQTPNIIGATNQGVFANLSARPENQGPRRDTEGGDFVAEDEQKDGPPVCSSPSV
jgi:hypothetical protein